MSTPAHWSSRFAFIMAAVGSAVGLGNVWKFPYMAGTGGGSAFVLVYLGCVLLVGVPILMAELMLGRRAGQSPYYSMVDLGRRFGGTPAWGLIGAMLAEPLTLTFWHALFMLGTVLIVARGVQAGIEKAVVWLMPMLFLMLVMLVGYAAVTGDFAAGFAYMFRPDFSKVTPDVVIAAAGQAFFSLSIGIGTMLAYGSYLPRTVSLPSTSVIIALADTSCALLAGVAIFLLGYDGGQLLRTLYASAQ